jgi:hypothetical protein
LLQSQRERDFYFKEREINKNQQRYTLYKLRRKIKHFYNSELPLLIEHGYIVAGVAANDCTVAASSHGAVSMTTISPRTNDKLVNYEAILTKRVKQSGPEGFGPSISAPPKRGTCGSEDRCDILTTLRAQQTC